MQKIDIYNRHEIKSIRKYLHNNSTSAEVVLWQQLKHKQLSGRKFRRQHSVGNYIIDFYCPSEKLAIELDGEEHFWNPGIERDNARTLYLNSLGIYVVGFENKCVFEDMEYVLDEIKKIFY